MKTTIRIPDDITMHDAYVQADHVETLKTSRNMNAAIYDCKGQKILVQDWNGTLVGNKEWGMYISDEQANYLLAVSNEGKEVDKIVREFPL
jgi:hypothetical protein